jgi:hypothetical protein
MKALPIRATALVAVLASAGCWRSGEAATRAPAPAPPVVAPAQLAPPPSPDPITQAKSDALAAYLAMYDDMAATAETSDYESPRLREHATGQAFVLIRVVLYRNHINGLVSHGKDEISYPQFTSATPPEAPTSVGITACVNGEHDLLYRADTNQLLNDRPGDRRLHEATVDRQATGGWLVSKLIVRDPASC